MIDALARPLSARTRRGRWRSTMPRPSISPAMRPPPMRSAGRCSCCPRSPSCRTSWRPKREPRWRRRGCDVPDRLPRCACSSRNRCGSIRRCRASTAQAVAADRLGEHEVRAGRHRVDLAVAAPPPSQICGTIPTRSTSTASPEQGRAPPLPISAVRGRPADLRRRPVRDGRGADHPRAMARRMAVCRGRPSRFARRAW